MALNGYFGKPGSGKSYSVVEYVVIPALSKGRHVITNIPLQGELLTQVYGGKVTQLPLDCLDDPNLPNLIPHGAVAIIDECWRRWGSGQKVSKASKDDLQWLKEHRHRVDTEGNAMQVVLVTQDPADLALWVRNLIAHSFHMYKLEEIGAANRFGIKVYRGCPVGERIPAKHLIREAYGTYKPDIYQYYSSATQSQSFDVGDEKAMDKRFNIWSSGQMLVILIFVPLALILGGYLFSYYFGMADRARAEQAEQGGRLKVPELPPTPTPQQITQGQLVAPSGTSAAAPVPAPAKPALPSISGTWRLIGYLKNRDADEPASRVVWSSIVGYGDVPERSGSGNDTLRWLEDVAVLKSWGGIRTYPLSLCVRMQGSRDYYCDIDGERVTPWSGQQGASEVVGGKPLDSAKEAVKGAPSASGAT